MTPIPRVALSHLSSGLRGVVTSFERAVRRHERVQAAMPLNGHVSHIQQAYETYDARKQVLLRKLARIENGPNEGRVEQMKRDLRRLAKAYLVVAGEDAKRLFPEVYKIASDIDKGVRKL